MFTVAVLLATISTPTALQPLPWQAVQRAFQSVSAFDPFARDTYSVAVKVVQDKAVVRLDSVSGLGGISIKMDSGRAHDRWKVGHVSFSPSLEPGLAEPNCTKALIGALPAMSGMEWLAAKRFRISASPTEENKVFVKIALAPYNPWDTTIFILSPAGKIVTWMHGY